MLEIIELNRDRRDPNWFNAKVAVDGKVSMPFAFDIEARFSFATEEEFHRFLERQARGLIAEHGDWRGREN